MALVSMCGFDDTTFELEWTFPSGGPPNQFQIGRDGVGQAAYPITGTAAWTPPVISTYPLYIGFAVKFQALFNSLFLRILDPLGKITNLVNLQSNGTFTTQGVTTRPVVNAGNWYYIEFSLAQGTGNWIFTMKVNGSIVLSNIAVPVTSGGTVALQTMYFLGSGSGSALALDDLYFCDSSGTVNNTFLGDCYVRTMLPINNGASSQFTNSAGTSVNNYSYVDEQNSSSVDYVGATTAGLEDLYAILDGTHPIPNDYVVHAIQGLVYAGKSDSGTPPNLSYTGKGAVGTVRKDALNLNLGTSYTSQNSVIQTTDPDGNALTPATVNNMQIGVVTS